MLCCSKSNRSIIKQFKTVQYMLNRIELNFENANYLCSSSNAMWLRKIGTLALDYNILINDRFKYTSIIWGKLLSLRHKLNSQQQKNKL